MGDLNTSDHVMKTIRNVDPHALDTALEDCLAHRRCSGLTGFGLANCGEHVASELRSFESAVNALSLAKSARKIDQTGQLARRAASSLSSALRNAQTAIAGEELQRELFYIDDEIRPPFRLDEEMSVFLTFQCRASATDPWDHGHIEFTHQRRALKVNAPSARRGAAQRRLRDDALFREWDHLRKLSLWSLREFFRKGGAARDVPKRFAVRVQGYERSLYNGSEKFWEAE